jgi:hypothetical protein
MPEKAWVLLISALVLGRTIEAVGNASRYFYLLMPLRSTMEVNKIKNEETNSGITIYTYSFDFAK